MPTVLNAANEIAVGAFMAGQIGFYGISEIVDTVCAAFSGRRLRPRPRSTRPWRSTMKHARRAAACATMRSGTEEGEMTMDS